MRHFRVYGDNIVECIRTIELIKENSLFSVSFDYSFKSQSVITAKGTIGKEGIIIDLIPGFDKSAKQRWKENILNNLKDNGGTLDETPDAFLTRIRNDEVESFICSIEYCSALQAGNQAWQRSGRAYSTGKTLIPYFYIIEYTRYELDSETRQRKAIRDPNAIVPFSYLAYTNSIKNPVIQAFFQSEEFDGEDDRFAGTDFKTIFSRTTISNYIVALMLEMNTEAFEKDLLIKTKNMVKFLLPDNSDTKLTKTNVEDFDMDNLLGSLEKMTSFNASKKIAKKSATGHIFELNDVFKKYSKGIFSSDLPFGFIPKDKINSFCNDLQKVYGFSNDEVAKLKAQKNIVFTLIKGFKPKGDDNRPDRGILPLLRMTFGDDCFILTILYGPILKNNFDLLFNDNKLLAKKNGLWQTIIYMSNHLLIDSDILTNNPKDTFHSSNLLDLTNFVFEETGFKQDFDIVNTTPIGFREDDVDTLIYMACKYHSKNTFIGLCNPPGGDWSGYSVIKDSNEYRWLSLPRVSEDQYKRPDHVIQFINHSKNKLLIIESKDNPNDLEQDIGTRLINYIKWLMAFVPSVKKENGSWEKAVNKIKASDFDFVSAGSYIVYDDIDRSAQLLKANVDIIFAFKPISGKWKLTIYTKNNTFDFAHEISCIFSSEKIISSIEVKIITK
jgi:hypothetical protein